MSSPAPHFILYSKPGCHLCEGPEDKLRQIPSVAVSLEIRDITTHDPWFNRYSLEIPVLCWFAEGRETELPRFSPRATVAHIESRVCRYVETAQ